jgi:hypothetical protein
MDFYDEIESSGPDSSSLVHKYFTQKRSRESDLPKGLSDSLSVKNIRGNQFSDIFLVESDSANYFSDENQVDQVATHKNDKLMTNINQLESALNVV